MNLPHQYAIIARMRTCAALLTLIAMVAGCSRSETSAPAEKPVPSTGQTVIEGVTGRAAVNAGQKARDDITRISEQRHRDLDAVLE